MLEGSEDDGLVLDGVDDEALAGLDEAGADVVDGGDGDDEAVLARARPLHLREQLLLHRVHQLRAEVARRQHDLVVQADVEEHGDFFRPLGLVQVKSYVSFRCLPLDPVLSLETDSVGPFVGNRIAFRKQRLREASETG